MQTKHPKLDELRRQLAEIREKHDRQMAERANLISRQQGNPEPDPGLDERLTNTNRSIARLDDERRNVEAEIGRLSEQLDKIARGASNPRAQEAGTEPPNVSRGDDPWQTGVRLRPGDDMAAEFRSRALTANERADYLPEPVREHMALQLERDDDPLGRLAQASLALSDRGYFRAFAKWLNDPVSGGHEWTPQEREAVQRVRFVERVLQLGGTGGFLTPYELDPAIIISSAGYVDPLRDVARVVTTAFNEKKFVTSAGVVSNWYAESAEVSDDTPTLVQPTVTCRKAMSFVPVSFEVYEDSDIAQQIGVLFADAKATHEATAFTTGTGTAPQPKGIITAVSAVGGSVIATATNALASADPYNNQAALPARWRPRAKFMANLSVINGYRQLPKATNVQESLVDDSGPRPKIAGWEVYENNAMDGTLNASAADYTLLSGDFQQFAIVDRIGSSVEVVPHLFGTNRRPTGERGFLLHWRTGSDVLIADAFRLTNHSG